MAENEILLDKCVEILQTVIQESTESMIGELKNENIEMASEFVGEISEGLSECFKVIKVLKTVASIPTKLYIYKFDKFCKDISKIPLNKRRAYIDKIGEKRFNKESIYLLNVINRIEEQEKLDVLYKLLEARINDVIDDSAFHRLILRTDATPISDLEYMRDNISAENFVITCDQQESLLSAGWIMYSGMVMLDFNDDSDNANQYHYSESARLFCKIVYGKVIDGKVSYIGIRVYKDGE